MRRIWVALTLLAVLACVSGCFEFTQEIWVEKDYSGRLSADFGISEQMTALSGMGGFDPLERLRQGYEDNKADLSADPNVKSVNLSERSDNGYHYFKFEVELKDITKLVDALNAAQPAPDALGEGGPIGTPAYGIEKLKNGDIRFHMELKDMAGRGEDGSDPFGGMGHAMALSMLSGRYFTVILHAPGEIKGNGELSADKRTATWQYSLGELFGGSAPPSGIEAEIDMPSPLTKLLLLGAIAVGLIALVLIVLGLVRKRKPRAVPDYPTAAPPPPE